MIVENVFTTAAFQASQFEGFVANNPVPVLQTIQPNSAVAGSAQLELLVTGDNFVSQSQVLWNGNARQTIFMSTKQLKVIIPAADLANSGIPHVTVSNPAPGGGQTPQLLFTITAPPQSDADAETEPNETIEQATPLAVPGRRTGQAAENDASYWYITYPDGTKDPLEDLFTFTLTSQVKLELALQIENRAADLDLMLFREENGSLRYVKASTLPAGQDDRLETDTLLMPGKYAVAVSVFSGSSRYTLTARGLDYFEVEPNDDLHQATPLTHPGAMRGEVAVGDSSVWHLTYEDGTRDNLEDFFALNLSQNSRVELALKAANATADLDLFLFREEDSSLRMLGYSYLPAGNDENIRIELAAGRYLIAVSAFGGSSTYSLTTGNLQALSLESLSAAVRARAKGNGDIHKSRPEFTHGAPNMGLPFVPQRPVPYASVAPPLLRRPNGRSGGDEVRELPFEGVPKRR